MRALPICLFPIALATAACANLGLPGPTASPAAGAARTSSTVPAAPSEASATAPAGPAAAAAAPAAPAAAGTAPAAGAPVAPVAPAAGAPAGPAGAAAAPTPAANPASVAAPAPVVSASVPATPAIGAVPTPATPRTSAMPTYPAAPGNPVVRGGAHDANAIVLEPGLYRCELSRRVLVRQVAADGQSIVLQWLNRDHTLQAVVSRAGALRYDDAQSGLAWITIPGKSLLLDVKKGQQLANECRL